jgi:predicted KAP-like P-loop ATPase
MWHDNETATDLLGFDYLSGALVEVVTEPRLLPVTVGVFGDWGSGKSSLLRMARDELKSREGVATIDFSAWQFESYEDVKAALMQVILQRLHEEQGLSPEAEKLFKKLVKRVDWFYALGLAATRVATLTPPSLDELRKVVRPSTEDGEEEETQAIQDFRRDFGELMRSIHSIKTLVIFIDDLDRCLPKNILETFEAIRLFLAVEKTAFVIAADERIIRYAISSRYPAEAGVDIGRDYLEKIVQVPLRIPPLTGSEVEGYLNLLFSQLSLEADGYGKLCAAAADTRKADALAVACNYGIAAEVVGEVPEALQQHFDLVGRIAPILAAGLNGNPRQLKRFMNALVLRQRAAATRGVTLDAAVLAKLMILEYLHEVQFRSVFEWQARNHGRSTELHDAEQAIAANKEPEDADAVQFVTDPALRRWAMLDPLLGDADLQPYFYFSRDKIEITAPGRRLPRALQELLDLLGTESQAHREGAQKQATELPATELRQLYDALAERFVRTPTTATAESLIVVATERPELLATLVASLEAAAPVRIEAATVLQFAQRVPVEHSRPLLERWAGQGGVKKLQGAAKTALRVIEKGAS